MKGLNSMKKRIIKILDNLTDEFVPDDKEKIFNAIKNNSDQLQVEKLQKRIHKKRILKYFMTAACVALVVVLSVYGINQIYNFSLNNVAPKEAISETVPPKVQQENRKIVDPKFNQRPLPLLKIGGEEKETVFENIQSEFGVNSIPFTCKCSFLFPFNSSDTNSPFAAVLKCNEETKRFYCIVSQDELVDSVSNGYRYTKANEIDVLLSNDEGHLYASFSLGNMKYLLDAEGFSEVDFVELVNLFIK